MATAAVPARRSQAADDRVRGLIFIVAMVVVMWALEVVDLVGGNLDSDGIHPRDVDGLTGIALAPFLHAGWGHLIGNTIPFLILGRDDRAQRARAHRRGDGDRRARGRPRHVAVRAREHEPHRRQRARVRLRRLPRRARPVQPPRAAHRRRARRARGLRHDAAVRLRPDARACRGRATCSARSAAWSPRSCCTRRLPSVGHLQQLRDRVPVAVGGADAELRPGRAAWRAPSAPSRSRRRCRSRGRGTRSGRRRRRPPRASSRRRRRARRRGRSRGGSSDPRGPGTGSPRSRRRARRGCARRPSGRRRAAPRSPARACARASRARRGS